MPKDHDPFDLLSSKLCFWFPKTLALRGQDERRQKRALAAVVGGGQLLFMKNRFSVRLGKAQIEGEGWWGTLAALLAVVILCLFAVL